jgi:hypothetical protein
MQEHVMSCRAVLRLSLHMSLLLELWISKAGYGAPGFSQSAAWSAAVHVICSSYSSL